MAELKFVLAGQNVGDAATALVAALDGGDSIDVTTTPVSSLPDVERRAVDLIALATLILTVPPAVLAIWDLVDRIRKKQPKAQAVVETAQRLRREQQVEVYLLAADQTQLAVADLDADGLLDVVADIAPSEG